MNTEVKDMSSNDYTFGYDFSSDACYRSVVFEVERLHVNVFEALGRAYVRASQDKFYNKRMIKAYEQYIKEHDIKWDAE
jgi:hypothetical protein